MIALRNWFPYGCMAPNGCDDRACPLCNGAETIEVDEPEESGRGPANVTRDGDPKLAAERPRGPLMFRKRHREGPNYVPRSARV